MIPSRYAWCLAITLIVIGISGNTLLDEPFRTKLAAPFAAVVLICVLWGIRAILHAGTSQVDADIDMLASASADMVQNWIEVTLRAPYGVALYLRVFAITAVIVIAPYIITLWIGDQQQRVVLLLTDAAFALWSLHRIYFWLYLAQRAQVIRRRKATRQSRL